MKNIRIEKVGAVNFRYPYLEVFEGKSINVFLDIGINDNKELSFKFYSSKKDIELNIEDWEYILNTAKEFLKQSIEDENTFNDWENKL